MEADGHVRDLRNHTICTCRLVITAAIIGANLLRLHAGNPPLFITVRVKWRYTLWPWKITRLCNCRRRSGMISCWSCLVQGWSLQNVGSLGAEKILRRSGTTWSSEGSSDAESWKARNTCRHLGRGQIFDHYLKAILLGGKTYTQVGDTGAQLQP